MQEPIHHEGIAITAATKFDAGEVIAPMGDPAVRRVGGKVDRVAGHLRSHPQSRPVTQVAVNEDRRSILSPSRKGYRRGTRREGMGQDPGTNQDLRAQFRGEQQDQRRDGPQQQ